MMSDSIYKAPTFLQPFPSALSAADSFAARHLVRIDVCRALPDVKLRLPLYICIIYFAYVYLRSSLPLACARSETSQLLEDSLADPVRD